MPRSIVQVDNAGFVVERVFIRVMGGERVKRGDDLRGIHLVFVQVEKGLLASRHEAQHIQTLGLEARQFQGGADGLPSVGDGREGGKARLVEKEQIDPSGIRHCLQALLVSRFFFKSFRVTPAFQRAPAAVPRVIEFFFKARLSVAEQEDLPVACSKLA